jgi:hypothetical protein
MRSTQQRLSLLGSRCPLATPCRQSSGSTAASQSPVGGRKAPIRRFLSTSLAPIPDKEMIDHRASLGNIHSVHYEEQDLKNGVEGSAPRRG